MLYLQGMQVLFVNTLRDYCLQNSQRARMHTHTYAQHENSQLSILDGEYSNQGWKSSTKPIPKR